MTLASGSGPKNGLSPPPSRTAAEKRRSVVRNIGATSAPRLWPKICQLRDVDVVPGAQVIDAATQLLPPRNHSVSNRDRLTWRRSRIALERSHEDRIQHRAAAAQHEGVRSDGLAGVVPEHG